MDDYKAAHHDIPGVADRETEERIAQYFRPELRMSANDAAFALGIRPKSLSRARLRALRAGKDPELSYCKILGRVWYLKKDVMALATCGKSATGGAL
jgi:hypothetical protein